jgi:hypothetical protein
MSPPNQKWKIYEFDVPVVSSSKKFHQARNPRTLMQAPQQIHAEKLLQNPAHQPDSLTSARKLMHRFREEEVERLMDEAEKD